MSRYKVQSTPFFAAAAQVDPIKQRRERKRKAKCETPSNLLLSKIAVSRHLLERASVQTELAAMGKEWGRR